MSFWGKLLKIADPIGAAVRKKTSGSIMDPLGYHGPAAVTTPYQRAPSKGLMAEPSGGPMSFGAPGGGPSAGPTTHLGGGNTGGYSYSNNGFTPPPPQTPMSAPQQTPQMMTSQAPPPTGGMPQGMAQQMTPQLQQQLMMASQLRNKPVM